MLTHILIRASLEAMMSCWKVSEYIRMCTMSQLRCVSINGWTCVCLCPYIQSVLLNRQQPDALPLSATPSSFIFFLCGCFFIIGGKGTGEGERRKSRYLFQLFFNHFFFFLLFFFFCGYHTAEQKTLQSQAYSVLSRFDHTEALKTEQTWTPSAHTQHLLKSARLSASLTNNILLCGR